MRTLFALAAVLALALPRLAAASDDPTGSITLTSPAFAPNAPIPRRYSSYADNHSPPLAWTPTPGAKAYALTLRDPDAPTGVFTHWLVWNIPGEATHLPEDGLAGVTLGANDAGSVGYYGPHPPYGRHHYVFQIFALDAPLDLAAGANFWSLNGAMRGHVLARGSLVGTFAP
jgi:Raf kinase inhibitor-like YbhB/YbcL family protein